MSKKVKKEKNNKLLVQVGIITMLIFVATLTFTMVMDYIITRDAYLSSKDEMINRDLMTFYERFESINHKDWFFSYLQEHSEELIDPLTPEELAVSESDSCYDTIERLLHDENADPSEEDEVTQMLFARHLYEVYMLNLDKNSELHYSGIWILGIQDEESSIIYMTEKSRKNIGDGPQVVYYPASEHSAVEKILSGEFKDVGKSIYEIYHDSYDGKSYYTGYVPLIISDNNKCVLCIHYDWSTFYNELLNNVMKSVVIGLIVLMLLNAILMYFIYKNAISPVMKVEAGIKEYMKDKDSSAVSEKMSKISVNNEIGVLADTFSDLTTEIDRYTKEILDLNKEKTKIQTELSLARNIQNSMLPRKFPAFPERSEFDIYASMDPAKEVGGDFYDFFMIDNDHLCLVIADVSGKGIPAALFMMSSKTVLENQAVRGISPADILFSANNIICANNEGGMFVTVWLGILELSTGKLTASNGGHEYPAIKEVDGKFELYNDRHGLVLGAMQGSKYRNYEIILQPGSTFFVYTDGVPEANDSDEKLFGTDRMIQGLNRAPDVPPEKILENVRSAVDEFVKDAEQFDDLTMLCVKYYGTGK